MKPQILYVDDEIDNLIGFKAVYRRQYEVHLAQNGQEALAVLKKHPIDLVISDQRMPKMTGVELLEQVRDLYPDVIRMILTGYSEMQSVVDAINKGKIYYYSTKPLDVENLKMEMNKALETYALRKKNRELEAEKADLLLITERQKRQRIHSQFEILKHQINPHFLFNSMNILSTLISHHPKKALEFTNQFSNTYRQVLELKEELLIPLRQELEFVESYLYLQKMRFTDNLNLTINIGEEDKMLNLPPFGLQLLIENAIKHNIVSMEQTLNIKVLVEEGYLIVENNWQPRRNKMKSTKIGLQNLTARYEFITDKTASFGKVGEKFIAKIPLIASF